MGEKIFRALWDGGDAEGKMEVEGVGVDSTVIEAKKGGKRWGERDLRDGKGRKGMLGCLEEGSRWAWNGGLGMSKALREGMRLRQRGRGRPRRRPRGVEGRGPMMRRRSGRLGGEGDSRRHPGEPAGEEEGPEGAASPLR